MVGNGYSVTALAGVNFPIVFVPLSVNQRLPSGPRVMKFGMLDELGKRNCPIVGVGESVADAAGTPFVLATIDADQSVPPL